MDEAFFIHENRGIDKWEHGRALWSIIEKSIHAACRIEANEGMWPSFRTVKVHVDEEVVFVSYFFRFHRQR